MYSIVFQSIQFALLFKIKRIVVHYMAIHMHFFVVGNFFSLDFLWAKILNTNP